MPIRSLESSVEEPIGGLMDWQVQSKMSRIPDVGQASRMPRTSVSPEDGRFNRLFGPVTPAAAFHLLDRCAVDGDFAGPMARSPVLACRTRVIRVNLRRHHAAQGP